MLKTLRCAAFPIVGHPREWHQPAIRVPSGSNANISTNLDTEAKKAPTLLERARAAFQALRMAGTDELQRAIAFGDTAMLLQEQVPKRKWQSYIRNHIVGASKTVVNECIRLAKARPVIEAHLDGMPSKSMSIRGALKLLHSLEKGNVKNPKRAKAPAADLASMLAAEIAKATPEELRAAFAASDFNTCRAAFPKNWVKKLGEDFTSQMLRGEKMAGVPVEPALKARIVKALQSALSHAKGGNNTDEHEALVALRGINSMLEREGCDLHDIGFAVAKPKIVRRRAA
jgi:hypothetical protein